MIAPGNDLVQALLAIAFVIASGYALGRIHQWYRDGAARDQAYRSGYDQASDGMLDMAIRKQAERARAVPALLTDERRHRDIPLVSVRPAAVMPAVGERTTAALPVGHARRRIVAG